MCWKADASVKRLTWTLKPSNRHVGSMIFLVHSCDDWFLHGSIRDRCGLLLLRSAPQPLWSRTRTVFKPVERKINTNISIWNKCRIFDQVQLQSNSSHVLHINLCSEVPTINPANNSAGISPGPLVAMVTTTWERRVQESSCRRAALWRTQKQEADCLVTQMQTVMVAR